MQKSEFIIKMYLRRGLNVSFKKKIGFPKKEEDLLASPLATLEKQ